MSDSPDWYRPPQGAGDSAAPESASEYVAAGFGVRFGGRLIDTIYGLILGFGAGIVGGILMVVIGHGRSATQPASLLTTMGLSMLGNLSYHALAESIGGATVGKAVLGLRVRSTSGGPAGVGATAIRSVLYFVDAFFFGLVAYSFMSKSRLQQRLGDRAADTVVVSADSLPADGRGNPLAGIAVGTLAWFTCLVLGIVIKAL